MLNHLIELAEHEVPVTYGSLRNSLDEVTFEFITYGDLSTFKSELYGTVIRGYINNLYVGIYVIPCADKYNLAVEKTDDVVIVEIYNYDKCGSYYNNIKYCTETRILKYDK